MAMSMLFAQNAGAFCVYNEIAKPVSIYQHDEGPFGKLKHFTAVNLQPGRSSCCNWSNKDCNPKGQRDSHVSFGTHVISDEVKTDPGTIKCFKGGTFDGRDRKWPAIEAGGYSHGTSYTAVQPQPSPTTLHPPHQ